MINNDGEANYQEKMELISQKLSSWDGPIVLLSHTDPDGDALGSTLALKRALDSLGKSVTLVMDVPSYLRFLLKDGELSEPIVSYKDGTLLAVLDVDLGRRVYGGPIEGAAFTLNIDHHGSNPRTGDLSCVQPSKAATALMVRDLLGIMAIAWTAEIATPCLTGILTDTGNFRYSNTDADVFEAAAFLVKQGVDYAALADRLQWREKKFFTMLGKVMGTVQYPLEGLAATAYMTADMREEVGDVEDDSSDYVGQIRYAEGTKVAIFFKESEGATKLSVRARDNVSAQNICTAFGGGGHIAAAGAKLSGSVKDNYQRVLDAAETELRRSGYL